MFIMLIAELKHFKLLRVIGKGAFGKVNKDKKMGLWDVAGSGGGTQGYREELCIKVHQQGQMHQNESRTQYNTRAAIAGGTSLSINRELALRFPGGQT